MTSATQEDDGVVASPAPYAVRPTYAIDLDESRLTWDLGQAENRALAASSMLDKARTWKTIRLIVMVAMGGIWVADYLLPLSYRFVLPLAVANFALLVARIGFVTRLSQTALACADSRVGIPTKLAQIVLAFIIPFYNFVMPFRIMRRLADASTTLDLPRVRVVHEVPETGTYRTSPKRVVVDATPPAPTPPMLVVWQILFIATFFASPATYGAVIMAACLFYEAFVFERIYRRFRARVRHLTEIARAIVPDR